VPHIVRALRIADEPARHFRQDVAVAEYGDSVGTDAFEHEGWDNRIEVGEHQDIIDKSEKSDEVVVSRLPSLANSIGGNAMAALANSNLHALDTKLDGWKRHEHKPSAKSSRSGGPDERNQFVGTEHGFERSATVLGDGFPRSLFRSLHTDHVAAVVAEIQAALPGFGLRLSAQRIWIYRGLQQQ
jgi:hypothetical protein